MTRKHLPTEAVASGLPISRRAARVIPCKSGRMHARTLSPGLSNRFTPSLALLATLVPLLCGCAAPISRADVMRLVSGGSTFPHTVGVDQHQAGGTARTAQERVALLAMIEVTLEEHGELSPALERMLIEILADEQSPEHDINAWRGRTGGDAIHALRQRMADACTAEQTWNVIHYGWGVILAVVGLPPESALTLLDGWEQFEHDSIIGEGLNLSGTEGAFGYLWDLENGMEGYSAAARFFRGE